MSTGEWNYADVWEVIADHQPDAAAQAQGDRLSTWREFDERADGVARYLLDAGAVAQDKVALYLYNAPEYLETSFAALKVGLVPVNTNYRYHDDELVYLWDNADAVAVVFHGAFTERIEGLRGRAPKVQTWLWVDDGNGPCPDWAAPYEDAATSAKERTRAPWGRSGDDLVMIYTGGTTGMPKGVMWQQHDLYRAFNAQGDPDEADLAGVARRLEAGTPPVGMPCCPLMHATGFMFSLSMLNQGGCVVTSADRHFDAGRLLDEMARHRVSGAAIVGDAFARPLADALDAAPGRWDLSELRLLVSAGVMWSSQVKEAMMSHLPGTLMVDMLGSTEAHGLGSAVASPGSTGTARFRLGPHALVVTPEGKRIEPGSGEVGLLAVRGLTPVGYFKDPEKSAATFIEIEGERCSVPGDWASVEADGTITLLGRGSVCINTAGEKVFPEEVEEALKLHPLVSDATVVGIPDERFGEVIAAAVALTGSGSDVSEADLIAHVKEHLAGYKSPRHVLVVGSVGRGPNGKADYAGVRTRIIEHLATENAGA